MPTYARLSGMAEALDSRIGAGEIGKLALAATVAILQVFAEFHFYGYGQSPARSASFARSLLNEWTPTLALLIPPIIAWLLLHRILRMTWADAQPRHSPTLLLVTIITSIAWCAGALLAVNTFGE